MKEPTPGWTTKAQIERVKDGDTVEVSITRTFALRLIHRNKDRLIFKAPELNTPEGIAAREYLLELLKEYPATVTKNVDDLMLKNRWREVTVFIPTNKSNKLMDMNSFERLLGELWVDGKMVTELMIDAGHAILEKR